MEPGSRLSSFYLLKAEHTGDCAPVNPPKNPRTFAFDFQIVLMSPCFFLSCLLQRYTKPQEHWTFLCPREREERAAKPHNQSRGANSDWLDVQTQGSALWSITLIISVKMMLVKLCFCETGSQLSKNCFPSLSLEFIHPVDLACERASKDSIPTPECPGSHRLISSAHDYWVKVVCFQFDS